MSDTIKTKRLGDITVTPTMTNKDQFIIIINGQEFLISKENLQKVFTGLSSDEYNKIARLDITGSGNKLLNDAGIYIDMMTKFDQNQFERVDVTKPIEIKGYHIHENQTDILDKFTVDENGALYFNGEVISSYTLPIASKDNLGGIKVDGTTITIDENGTIHGANTYILPTASDTVLGGVKVDNDTIKVNEGVISADVIGNWSAGTSYPVGYFVVYNDKLYECINANSDNVFTESNWKPIGGSTGTTINNWSASTDYVVGDLVINGTTLYQCNTEHISGDSFNEAESANWTVLSGEQGVKGDDGITPHIDSETGNWFIGETDTGIGATVGIDDTSTSGTDVTWSASKINSMLGDINTILASVTGGIE